MAILATVNLGFVIFDLSYVRLRDFWLQGEIPLPLIERAIRVPILSDRLDTSPITRWYDPLKGIEPYRDTEQYLEQVEALNNLVRQRGLETLQQPQAQALLADLRNRSIELIDTNPFAIANKTGTLEKIKNEMRRSIFNTTDASSKEAFDIFWSEDYLVTAPPNQGLGFFNQKIVPLLQTNYYRSIDETGSFTDLFWERIDIWFAAIFFIEFLARTYFISRNYKNLSWRDAMLWRWYDILLFLPEFPLLPPYWRLLRVIPVIIRLNQADLIELEPIRAQASRGFVTSFAEELTEVIILNAINQLQDSVKSGDLARQLINSAKRRYIDLNNVNELEAIATHLFKVIAYQVLPTIQPDIEALLRYNLQHALKQSSTYQNLQIVPGINQIYARLTDQIITQISTILTESSQSAYNALTTPDPVGEELFNNLVQHFGESLGTGIQQQQTLNELETLVSDFLEEFKLNYVRRLGDEDIERILKETRRLQQAARK